MDKNSKIARVGRYTKLSTILLVPRRTNMRESDGDQRGDGVSVLVSDWSVAFLSSSPQSVRVAVHAASL